MEKQENYVDRVKMENIGQKRGREITKLIKKMLTFT